MAISRQRLTELIEQGATIYKIRDNMIIDYQLCSYNYLEDNELIYENVITNYCRSWIGKLDDFFETEEDARWELEMTATRTETLKLPTWKQFRKGKIILFMGKDKNAYNLTTFSHTLVKDKKLEVYNMTDNKILFEKPLTKENYIKACKLCKKLFKGEEV